MSLEYSELLDEAAIEQDSTRRIALIAAFMITSQTVAEKSTGKPFNPLLSETFEFVTDKIQFLAEQVSHHPPIAAIYCRGKHWTMSNNHKINISFNGKNILANHEFRTYFTMENFDEDYEVL